jgi:hypothetical protein
MKCTSIDKGGRIKDAEVLIITDFVSGIVDLVQRCPLLSIPINFQFRKFDKIGKVDNQEQGGKMPYFSIRPGQVYY